MSTQRTSHFWYILKNYSRPQKGISFKISKEKFPLFDRTHNVKAISIEFAMDKPYNLKCTCRPHQYAVHQKL